MTLGPNTKCEKGKPDGSSYDGEYDAASSKTVLKFVHEATAPTAAVADVTIDGVKDSLISNKEVKITLMNDKFKAITVDSDVSSWFTNRPAGLEAKIKTAVNDNDTTATVEISGTPIGNQFRRRLSSRSPRQTSLRATADLNRDEQRKREVQYCDPTTPITETLVPVTDLTGKTYNESAQQPTFGGSLTPGTDYTVSYAVKSTFTGTLNSDGKPVGAGTYVVTVTGMGSYTGSFTKDFEDRQSRHPIIPRLLPRPALPIPAPRLI